MRRMNCSFGLEFITRSRLCAEDSVIQTAHAECTPGLRTRVSAGVNISIAVSCDYGIQPDNYIILCSPESAVP